MAVANSTRPRARKVSSAQELEAREALETAVRTALRECAYEPVRRVECVVRGGAVLLLGRVPSFYLKQIAQCVVSGRLKGAAIINNQIEVTGP